MSKRGLWTISFIVTTILFLGYCFLLYDINHRYLPPQDELTTQQDVTDYFKKNNAAIENDKLDKPLFIPTGLFIDSVKFIDPNTVNLTGYVWQKYSKATPTDITRGVVFPEASNAKMTKAYEFFYNNYLRIGWYFEANFTQGYNYTKYPLDNKIIQIRLWPEDFEKNIVLIPDLAAYSSTKTKDLFGMNSRYSLQGYTFKETYFNYRLANYDTNFGLDDYGGLKNFPELYFNIVLQRNMTNAIITNLIPLLVALVILFGSMSIITRNKTDQKKFGFSMNGILGLCSFMLFVVLTAHIRLRESVVSGGIIYLEYIYFIMYFATVYVAIVAFLTLKTTRNQFIDFLCYEDSIFFKILYLPIILGLTILISYICLY